MLEFTEIFAEITTFHPFLVVKYELFSKQEIAGSRSGFRRRARGRPTIHATRHVGSHPEIARDHWEEGDSGIYSPNSIFSNGFHDLKVNLQLYRERRVKGAVWGILISPPKILGSQLERQIEFRFPTT